ncbi:uncharacterized protein LOC106949562 isoform X1 [Poecilia latipinna]|uniref:uncharacterized protein LOC106949562 isoform X1 n=1 Tax=Poecilia latipinna TaxID=48699 RepID=UPI00072DE0B7|nr:PREDICTED: uncharacterized protein LOC106949562 isoform X1 [Poecilia latipinna]XP_014891389.1 PREDICTED: uncharacterized protein LOC106949562 isoform X1 [Poecilia latipinna]XP_014891390.1 PREDICTED: uncharacterized protein LOC106949562 isoform X1 [Poecilia latipinna]
MEECGDWEINIPVEAEVKTVPLKNLPNSVIRRIGLPVSEGDSAWKQSDSTDVTWICPVVVRRKGQESVSGSGRHLADNLLPFVGTQVPASPLKMSFVSSNRAARDVLKNISPGRRSSKEEFLSQDTALLANDDAVVVYKGQIYLCIRKAKRRARRTRKQQPVCQAAMPSTSGQPSTTHNRELIGGRPKTKTNACKVKRCEKAALKTKGVSSVRDASSAPRPSDGTHRADGNSPGRNQEEASVWTNHMNGSQVNSQDDEHSGSQWWTQAEPVGVAAASISRDSEYEELEREEEIAHLYQLI